GRRLGCLAGDAHAGPRERDGAERSLRGRVRRAAGRRRGRERRRAGLLSRPPAPPFRTSRPVVLRGVRAGYRARRRGVRSDPGAGRRCRPSPPHLANAARPLRAAARPRRSVPGVPSDRLRARFNPLPREAPHHGGGRRPFGLPLLPRPFPPADPRMTAAALVVYAILLAVTVVAVWLRPTI